MNKFLKNLSEDQKDRLEILIGKYPIDAFPDIYKIVILKLALYLNVYVSLIANTMLAEIAYLISGFINASDGRGGSQPCSLFVLSIAESGDGKDSTFKFISKASRDNQDESFEIYKCEMQEWLNTPKSEKFERPSFETTIFDNATIQGITKSINASKKRSFIISNAEASIFFYGFSMNSDSSPAVMGIINNLLDEGRFSNLIKNQDIIEYRNDVRLSIVFAMQDIIGRKFLTNKLFREQGFLARVLFTAPPPPPFYKKSINDSLDIKKDFDYLKYQSNCKDLIVKGQISNKISVINYNQEALEVFVDYDNFIRQECLENGTYSEISAYAKRSRQYVWRVATILAYISNCDINMHIMKSAVNIFKFSLSEWLKYYGCDDDKVGYILLKWLKKEKMRGKVQVLVSSINQVGPEVLRNARTRDEAIQFLEELKLIECIKDSKKRNKYVSLIC